MPLVLLSDIDRKGGKAQDFPPLAGRGEGVGPRSVPPLLLSGHLPPVEGKSHI